MNKKEIKAEVKRRLDQGEGKAAVFASLQGQGVKDGTLAYLVAAHPDPVRCSAAEGKVNGLIILMFIQAVVAFLIGYGLGVRWGAGFGIGVGALLAAIPLLFALGFYRNAVGAYNAYLLLSITQMPRQLEGMASHPVAVSVGLAITLGLVAYVAYLRYRLFPEFAAFTPRKDRQGQYVFSS